jgi:CHAT domain-containing protein
MGAVPAYNRYMKVERRTALRAQKQRKRKSVLLRTVLLAATFLMAATMFLQVAVGNQPTDADSREFNKRIDAALELRRAHRYHEAITILTEALAWARARGRVSVNHELDAMGYLALTYRDASDLQRVLTLRLQVLGIVRANPKAFAEPYSEEASALQDVAGAYFLLNDLPSAVKYASAAVEVEAPHVGEMDTVGMGHLRQFLGQLLLLSGNLTESEKVLRMAYDDFEARLRLTDKLGPHPIEDYQFELGVLRWLERVLVAQGRYEEALQVTEQSRERTTSGVLRLTTSLATRPAMSVTDIKEVAKKFNTTMVIYSIAYELDPDLLLEFSDFVDTRATELYIWVIRPNDTIGFRIVQLKAEDRSLADLIADARLSIGARGRGALSSTQSPPPSPSKARAIYPALKALNRILIDPIADLLPASTDSSLMLLPQDRLYFVPFAALQDQSGDFLVMRHALFVNYSVAALSFEAELLRHASEAAQGVLVVGNPKMPGFPARPGGARVPLPALPEAEREARDIASIFQANALLGQSATKEAVVARMPTARIVHFATHGLMDRDEDQSQYFDSLALAPGDGDDGFLTAREIDKMHLAAELVVLSACDTADGKPTGDGVLGFSSAFLAAGVPSVVVAQWSIPDAPTALLMRTFYDQLMHGQDKVHALQQAMLVVMNQHPDPGSWAAFSLIGEPAVASSLATVVGNSATTSRSDVIARPILVPNDVTQYSEDSDHAGPSAVYETRLSISEILRFYRYEYTKLGLVENTVLTQIEPETASMVMTDSGPLELVVQVTDFDDPAGTDQHTRTVSVRYEHK